MGGCGGRGGPPRVSPFRGDTIRWATIIWCETVTPPICGERLFSLSLSLSSFGPKTHWFCGKDLFFLSSPILGPKKSATTKSRPGATILRNATEFCQSEIKQLQYLRKLWPLQTFIKLSMTSHYGCFALRRVLCKGTLILKRTNLIENSRIDIFHFHFTHQKFSGKVVTTKLFSVTAAQRAAKSIIAVRSPVSWCWNEWRKNMNSKFLL